MATKSVITLTTAPAGTGKTYRRGPHFLLNELLPDSEQRHVSNFPLELEEWEGGRGLCAIGQKYFGLTPEVIRDRIELIPQEEINRWRDGESGPWDYFGGDYDLSGCHVAIDEIHNFCGRNAKPAIQKQWQEWLGEIRHRGARIEFITQHPQKMAKLFREEAEVLLELVKGESRRDPFFNIGMGDWYNVFARLTGKYSPAVFEQENRQNKSRFEVVNEVCFRFDTKLFECYDSFSTPVQGGKKGVVEKEPWQRMGPFKFWFTFLFNNFGNLALRFGLVVFFLWASVFGGGSKMMTYGMDYFQSYITSQATSQPVKKPQQPEESEAIRRLREKFPNARIEERKNDAPKVEGTRKSQEVPDRPLPPPVIPEESIQAVVEPWSVSAVTIEGVWFRNGEFYQIGETIDYGPYQGKKVVRVDLVRRRCVVGGDLLRLGSSNMQRLRKWAVDEIRSREQSTVQ